MRGGWRVKLRDGGWAARPPEGSWLYRGTSRPGGDYVADASSDTDAVGRAWWGKIAIRARAAVISLKQQWPQVFSGPLGLRGLSAVVAPAARRRGDARAVSVNLFGICDRCVPAERTKAGQGIGAAAPEVREVITAGRQFCPFANKNNFPPRAWKGVNPDK